MNQDFLSVLFHVQCIKFEFQFIKFHREKLTTPPWADLGAEKFEITCGQNCPQIWRFNLESLLLAPVVQILSLSKFSGHLETNLDWFLLKILAQDSPANFKTLGLILILHDQKLSENSS